MNPTETLQNLDENFLFLLNLVKNHPQTFADRPDKDVLLQAWLHKLCIDTDYVGIDQKRNRNVYLCKLLASMQARQLTGPFLQKPRPGKLKQWPLPMPVLEEPQWVRDLDAVSKKTTRVGGKDLKTYISTKRLDNNRGLCALLSVSVADERGEPGFKQIGTNKLWGDIEKEYAGMETQIATESLSPNPAPKEMIEVLEEKLQNLEAHIPPEPLPLRDIVTPKPVKKKKIAPTGESLSQKSVTDLKRSAQPKAPIFKPKLSKPKLTKPTPPKRKEIDTTSPASPLSPEQVAFNKLEVMIEDDLQTNISDIREYTNELMEINKKMQEMEKERHYLRQMRRKGRDLSPFKSKLKDADGIMGELNEQRKQQKERQRQMEAELFAKTPSPQPASRGVPVAQISPGQKKLTDLEKKHSKTEKTPPPRQPVEQELSPTPPIVRELREKQQRRILAQRRQRAKMNQQPSPPSMPEIPEWYHFRKETDTTSPTSLLSPEQEEFNAHEVMIDRNMQVDSSDNDKYSSEQMKASGAAYRYTHAKMQELRDQRERQMERQRQLEAELFAKTPSPQNVARAVFESPVTPEQKLFNHLEAVYDDKSMKYPSPDIKIKLKKMEAARKIDELKEERQRQLARQWKSHAELYEKTPSPNRPEDQKLSPTPPIVRELREKQQRRILAQRRERARINRQPPPSKQTRDATVAATPSMKFAGKSPVHLQAKTKQHETDQEQARNRGLEILKKQMMQMKQAQSLITPPKQISSSSRNTPSTQEMPEWLRKKDAGKSPVHIPSSEEVQAEKMRQRKLESEIKQRQQEAQLRQQQLLQNFITPPKQQKATRRSPGTTPPTPEMPEWIRKKYAGKSPIHIPSSEEVQAERMRQLAKPKTAPKSGLSAPGSKLQRPKSTVIVSSSKTTETITVKESTFGLTPPTQSLMRQPPRTGMKPPPQATELRAPAAKESAYGLKSRTPTFTRQASSTGLKPPSQLKFPKRG